MNKLLRCREVCELLGISPSTLWRWGRSKHFPTAIKLGPNTVAWSEAEISDWLLKQRKAKERV